MEKYYIPFKQFVFRTPLQSFNFLLTHLTAISKSDEKLKRLFENKKIQETIYLASPSLFEEMKKYIQKGLSDRKEEERLKYSLLRYLCRMSTRCTPFGLFAGCSVGQFEEYTDISMAPIESFQRHTRLDMHYLCALAQEIAIIPEIKRHFKFYCNTSVYHIGDSFRYVEYFYNKTRRIHRIANVDYSVYLDKILKNASDGLLYDELVSLLTDEEIDCEEASAFIDELIDSQLLISELEPTVTGVEFFLRLFQKLSDFRKNFKTNDIVNTLINRLEKIHSLLNNIDKQPIGNTIEIYDLIISEIEALGTKFEKKYLFQTDLFKPAMKATLNMELANEILGTIEFLNKITIPLKETPLTKFREAFYQRYEEREMPLLQVLDNESGIGYNQIQNSGDINPLIDDLQFPRQNDKGSNTIFWDPVQSVMLKKYTEAIAQRKYIIDLSDTDFENLKTRWDDLPSTISVMCKISENNEGKRETILKSSGGSSAANLLGRFCYINEQIKKNVLQITQKEEELNPHVIYAEIAHLPESRIGNILSRPVLRTYEIPYLAKSSVEKENQIELSDLLISVRKNRIILRSKRLNKEIIPRLTNAHNFRNHPMPVYHFLCDMQMQEMRSGIFFSWGNLASVYNWFPRVGYKNVILSPARWTIKQKEIREFFDLHDDASLVASITTWREAMQMPKFVMLDDGDNELFIDLENALSIRMLFSLIKKRPLFNLEEFIFNPNHAIVKNEEGTFINEFIISFYKGTMNQ